MLLLLGPKALLPDTVVAIIRQDNSDSLSKWLPAIVTIIAVLVAGAMQARNRQQDFLSRARLVWIERVRRLTAKLIYLAGAMGAINVKLRDSTLAPEESLKEIHEYMRLQRSFFLRESLLALYLNPAKTEQHALQRAIVEHREAINTHRRMPLTDDDKEAIERIHATRTAVRNSARKLIRMHWKRAAEGDWPQRFE